MKELNIENIIILYTKERYTLRMIAKEYETNHHTIKRVLVKNNIEITNKGRKRKPFTEEHKRKISESAKKRESIKGYKHTEETRYKNMASHLRYDVELEWLMSFGDLEKLKYLNSTITKGRTCNFCTEEYIEFINKFFYDEQFNMIYNKWKENDKNNFLKPSLDHIIPKSRGGESVVENFQFLTWFENRAKVDMTQDEWSEIKNNINNYLL